MTSRTVDSDDPRQPNDMANDEANVVTEDAPTDAATWRVTPATHDDFVAMSGDANPLHTDPLVARRSPFGRPAVHGLHLVLDALERVVQATGRQPVEVRATFRHAVGVDDEVTTTLDLDRDDDRDDDPADDPDDDRDNTVAVTVTTDAWVAAEMTIGLGQPACREVPHVSPPHERPELLSAADLIGRSGAIAVAADIELAERRFPALAAAIGHSCLAELLSLTRLVGMHVPGYHSLLSSIDVSLDAGGGRDGLAYDVTRFDERFGLATIRVDGPNVAGSLRAFLRPEPVEPDIDTARPEPDEFAGQRWLVAGGSRGLGAIAVLQLDAGGADVRFTFRSGSDDAARLALRTSNATAHHLDVDDPGAAIDAMTADDWEPTHLAYFASPPIFDGVQGVYSAALEQRFRSVYLDGFERLIARFAGLRAALWPSSEAAGHDVAGLAEYANVKRDGEALCRRLTEGGPFVHAPRFPRLQTDQTASFVPVEYGDAPTEVLTALRTTCDGARA